MFCVDINDTATEAYTASGHKVLYTTLYWFILLSLSLSISLFSLSLFLKTVRICSITEPDPQCIRCIKISTHQLVMSLSYSEVSDSTIHNTKSI